MQVQLLEVGSDKPFQGSLAAFFDEAEAPTEKEHADLREALHAFRKGVDEMLPGVYRWLEPGSLHCTVRALDS